MAETVWHHDPADSSLTQAKAALVAECAREEENALYTSTTFFIWLRLLKAIRAAFWGGAALGSTLAASHILHGDPNFKVAMAASALVGVLLPGIARALRLDATIREYAEAAGKIKNLQGDFRRARLVWSHQSLSAFEAETRKLFKAMNDSRRPSLTPPEFCFLLARRKIGAGHYSHEIDVPDDLPASKACSPS